MEINILHGCNVIHPHPDLLCGMWKGRCENTFADHMMNDFIRQ
jgi:hypothetical protein